ncbi:MAG TPA: hypothetical protein VGS03_16010 [Candidatus Polarisedimenticolia bacterium]|nr:hypothetical protein [Candidatus Polarisedimenticolia bacterium]
MGNVRAFELSRFEEDVPVGTVVPYETAIVVSQDCDLEQDHVARFPAEGVVTNQDKLLFGIALCGTYDEALVKAGAHREGAAQLASKEWKPVVKNMMPRFQYLGFIPQIGKTLVADFKDLFFVPADYLYRSIADGDVQRLASLREPYREHVLQRFVNYVGRVGLPKDFEFLVPPPPPVASRS